MKMNKESEENDDYCVDELFIYFSFYLVDLFYNVLYNMYVNKEVII